MNRWQLGSFGLAAGLSPINEPSTGSWDSIPEEMIGVVAAQYMAFLLLAYEKRKQEPEVLKDKAPLRRMFLEFSNSPCGAQSVVV